MPTWPPALPQLVTVDGYDEAPPDTLLRSSVDGGPAKVRRRFTANARPITCSVIVDENGLALFDQWFEEELRGGAERFDWVHPRTRAFARLRFVGMPAFRPRPGGRNWTITMRLELLPV